MKSKLLAIFIIFNSLFILGCNRNDNNYCYNGDKYSI